MWGPSHHVEAHACGPCSPCAGPPLCPALSLTCCRQCCSAAPCSRDQSLPVLSLLQRPMYHTPHRSHLARKNSPCRLRAPA